MVDTIRLFNKYDNAVSIRDPGLIGYISTPNIIVPRNEGRQETKRFWKSEDMHIVERLITKMMVSGHKGKKHNFTSGRNSGKFVSNAKTVLDAFDIIEQKTNDNPIQILVRAIEYSAPMEEVTTIEYGGIRHPKAVDCSPQRRVDLALRWLTQGVYLKCVKNKRSAAQVLADELIKASKDDKTSFSITKKVEAERQAAASR
ncbi:30S ribosomal protein S7 [archaeon CG10_big_fil_rev_8_21_14_0_10_43_11]|nr:MAG: 30S ribosomal protein S7 [archaeon CG10_big_fil_rev_8_21_14_0_10_43_11]